MSLLLGTPSDRWPLPRAVDALAPRQARASGLALLRIDDPLCLVGAGDPPPSG